MAEPLDVDRVVSDGAEIVVAAVHGDLDSGTVGAVRSRLYAATANVASGLVLDLATVPFMDSAGVEMLLRLGEELRVRQQRLLVVLPPDALPRRTLELSGGAAQLTVVDTVDAATALLGDDA
jgi:stage II sporulation protein AA (anti-sigma F factor antagonist)